jgi:GT2 family glycosyltransferase
VIVPHYNDLSNLGRCLELLGHQRLEAPFETIVVDNCSSVPLGDIERTLAGRARLVLCEERGAGPARNAGIAATAAPRLAFVDSDCRPREGWLAAGYSALDRWDFAGGHVEVDIENEAAPTAVESFERVFAFRFSHYIERKGFSGSGNLFVRRKVFDAVGGFKAQVSEDVEWCHRATAAGFRLGFEPRAIAGHPARRDWLELKRKWTRTTREAYLLMRSQPAGAFKWLLRSWAVLFSIAPHAVKVLITPQLSSWRSRLGALGVLVRIRAFRFAEAHRLAWQQLRGRA